MSFLLLLLAIPFYWAGQMGGVWAVVGLFAALWAMELLIRRAVRSRRNFQHLPPIEQALRRASQGFALMVFAILAVVVPYAWLYGWKKFAALLPWMLDHPGDAWPVLVCAGLFAIGLVRFLAAVPQCAGARDGIRRPSASVKLAFGIGLTGYMMMTYPWGQFGATAVGFFVCVLGYAVGLWCALVGAVRFALLSFSFEPAENRMGTHIAQQATTWNAAGRRSPWWKFWKK